MHLQGFFIVGGGLRSPAHFVEQIAHIVEGFGKSWLEPQRLVELPPCLLVIPTLEQRQAKIVVSRGRQGILLDSVAPKGELAGIDGGALPGGESQPQTNTKHQTPNTRKTPSSKLQKSPARGKQL